MSEKLIYSCASGALIVLASMLSSGYSEYIIVHDIEYDSIVYGVLYLMYLVGWGGIIYGLNRTKSITPLLGGGMFVVIASTLYLMYQEIEYTVGNTDDRFKVSFTNPLLYTLFIGWLIFAWAIVPEGENAIEDRKITVATALVILFSTLYSLPKQRKSKLVDGPSYFMLTLAWTVMSNYISKRI